MNGLVKTKRFTLLQLMNIIDGRLFTNLSDIRNIINHVTGESLFRHQMLPAFSYIELINPKWFDKLKDESEFIEGISGRNYQAKKDFIISNFPDSTYLIPALTDKQKKGLYLYLADYSTI